MRFEKIKAPSQKEMFVKKIQEMILTGDLPAGTYLPPERELSEQMGVSRTVVTTGIAILESQGFIKVIPRQGNVVEDIRMNGTVETLNAMLKLKGDILTDNDIRAILEIRWALEHLTMKNAIERISDEEVEKLRLMTEKIGETKSPKEAAEIAMEFQRQLCLIGKNQMALLIISSFRLPCVAMWVRFCRIYGIEMLYKHTYKSWEYIKARDYDGAAKWIERFMADAIDGSYTLYSDDIIG